ncbi:MAG: LamG-like jellyroll fold domain-containing protein [Verrucomicrobiota bacterium]
MRKSEFERLAQRVLDGEGTESDVRKLEDAVRDSEDLRTLYRDIFVLDAGISREAIEQLPGRTFEKPAPIRRILHRQKKRDVSVALAVAVVLVLGAVVAFQWITFAPSPFVKIRLAPHTEWLTYAQDGSQADPDNLRPGDTILIEGGSLELSFRKKVKGVVQGPAQMTLEEGGNLVMAYGTGRFEIEGKAREFIVRSPRLSVRDLGTAFGIVIPLSDRIHPEVHVFEGKVVAQAMRGVGESRHLLAGEAFRVLGSGELEAIEPNPDRFYEELPTDLPYLRLTFEPQEGGGFEAKGTHPLADSLRTSLEGEVTSVPGIEGQGVSFGRPGSRLTTNWDGVLGDAPRTIAAWVRIPETSRFQTFRSIVGWGDPTIGFAGKTELLCFQEKAGAPVAMRLSFDQFLFTGETDLADGKWHHLVAVYDPRYHVMEQRVTFYVDGRLEKLNPSLTSTVRFPATPDTRAGMYPLVVGELPNIRSPRNFDGVIDEVWVFEAALDEARVRELAGVGPNE